MFPPKLIIWPRSILINFPFNFFLFCCLLLPWWGVTVSGVSLNHGPAFYLYPGHLYWYSSSFESRENGRHSPPSTMVEMLIICGSESLSIFKLISSVFLSVHLSFSFFSANFDSLKEFPIWTLYVVWVTHRFSDVLFKISSKTKDVFYFPMKKNSLPIPREREVYRE